MSDFEQLYQQVILDHAKQRTGNEPLAGAAGPDVLVASSHQVNPTCGDEITVEVRRPADGSGAAGELEVRWDGDGCSISMASASVMTELAEELSAADFARVDEQFYELMHSRGQVEPDEDVLGDASAFAGVSRFPARVKCALLSWMALKDALYQIGPRNEEGADRA